ncbi:MAG: cyclic nucleotide-binding domain-containing protein [Elusimicrobiota bacterium]
MDLTTQDLAWAKETLRNNDIFSNCTEAEITELSNGMEKQCYNQGQTVLFQGEISSRLCMVQSGKVSVWVRKNKDKTKVAELGTGAVFGEISLMTPRAATATIKSEETTEIVFLSGEIVQAMAKKTPSFSETINKKIEEHLAKSKQAVEDKQSGKDKK